MQTPSSTTSESALAAGCLLYSRILGIMDEMQAALQLCSSTEINRLLQELGKLQSEAAVLDQQINAEILGDPAATSSIARRGELLKELLLKNQELQKNAKRCQSLYVHEMNGLRQGMSALQGYKSSLSRSGKLVNSSL